mgnify:CR=1 FL=1
MHTWFECKIRYEKVMENGYLQVKKKLPTAGSNANLFSSHWTTKVVQKKRLPLKYWYRLPTCAMP